MRLRHSDLEAARTDPIAFSNRDDGGGFGQTKIRALHQAVFKYHRPGETLATATDYLENAFATRFKTASRLDEFVGYLDDYDRLFRLSSNVVIKVMLRISVLLTQNVTLVGEVPRLDITAGGGYAAWLFSEKPRDWRDELRMPIVQAYIASLMGVKQDHVAVGFYFFAPAAYESVTYSATAVAAAFREATALAQAIE